MYLLRFLRERLRVPQHSTVGRHHLVVLGHRHRPEPLSQRRNVPISICLLVVGSKQVSPSCMYLWKNVASYRDPKEHQLTWNHRAQGVPKQLLERGTRVIKELHTESY